MPNWAFGDVDVTGTKAAVTSFSERFIFKEEPRTTPGKRIFGRSFHEIVSEDLQAKLKRMPDDARAKLRQTLERIINEGSGGLICIIL